MGITMSPGAPFNRQTTSLVQPTLEDALGITFEEAQVLRAIAIDCEARSASIHLALKPLVLELRFAALAEEPSSAAISERYQDLNRQRTQMVRDHVEGLKSAFGATRFARVEDFVGARKDSGSFFPAVPRVAPR